MFITILLILFSLASNAQMQMTNYKARDINGATVISWNAPPEELTLLIVQRSLDSINGFRSIASMPDPNSRQNGYVDKNNKSLLFYYRLFYVGINGKYYFTNAIKSIKEEQIKISVVLKQKDSSKASIKKDSISKSASPISPEFLLDNIEVVPRKETIDLQKAEQDQLPTIQFKITIETEKVETESTLKPNPLLFTNKENNLVLILPETHKRKFHLYVYKENGSSLFEMKNIKEPQLLIDRSNFIYSGWFRYEIFEGEQLKEKGKFLINAD